MAQHGLCLPIPRTRISLYVTSEETSRTFCEHAPGCQKDITSLQYIAHILHCPSCLWYLTTWLDRLVYRNDELEAPAKAQQCRNAGSVLCQVAVSQEVLLRPEDFGSQVGVSPLSPLRKVWLILLLDSLNMSQLRVPSSSSCGSRVMKQQARQRWNQMHKCLFCLETSHFIESDADRYIWPHVFFPWEQTLPAWINHFASKSNMYSRKRRRWRRRRRLQGSKIRRLKSLEGLEVTCRRHRHE